MENSKEKELNELTYILDLSKDIVKLRERVDSIKDRVDKLEKQDYEILDRLNNVEDVARSADTSLNKFGDSFKTFFVSFVLPILVTLVLKLFGA